MDMEPIDLDVQPDEVGILSVKPPMPVSEVRAQDGWALVDGDGTVWRMRFLADGVPVGVVSVVLITGQEVEVVQVPGGPSVDRVRLVPE